MVVEYVPLCVVDCTIERVHVSRTDAGQPEAEGDACVVWKESRKYTVRQCLEMVTM